MEKSAFSRFLAHKWWVWFVVSAPFAWPVVRYLRGDPRVLADPVEYCLNYTGLTAVLCLCAILSLTPLRIVFGGEWTRSLNRHRRLIGNASWAWATLHLFCYTVYAGSWTEMETNLMRPFIMAGVAAWLILSVLAFTSWKRVLKALGGRRWKRLHRTVYLAAALAFFHYWDQEKTGWGLVPYFVVPLISLEAARIIRRLKPSRAA